MQIFSKIDIGSKRNTNQDACFAEILPDGTALAVVCDGMGGANAGDIASNTAVKLISEYVIRSYSATLDSFEVSELLRNAVISANFEIFDLAYKDESLKGMGTTVVVAVVKENYAVICHVGDSRAYVVSDGIQQITRDHSVVQNLIESGELTLAEAKVHPKKNVITKALGVEENVIPDCSEIPFDKRDYLLICTDGLSNFVDKEDILLTFKENNVENITDILIDKANSAGGGDNITAVVVSHQKG